MIIFFEFSVKCYFLEGLLFLLCPAVWTETAKGTKYDFYFGLEHLTIKFFFKMSKES